jgi:hypothetical protein
MRRRAFSFVLAFVLWCAALAAQTPGAPAPAKPAGGSATVKEEPTLTFVEAPSGAYSVASADSPDVQITLTLQNTATKAAAMPIAVAKPKFAIAGHAPIEATSIAAPATVAPLSLQPLTLTVKLPDIAVYRGTLWLTYGGGKTRKILSLPLEVTRTRKALNVDVADLTGEVAQVSTFSGSDPVRVVAHIQNNDTQPIPLRAPLVRSVTYKPKSDSQVATVAPGQVTVRFEDTNQPPTLKPDADTPVRMVIDGITHAGRYDATIRLGSAGTATVDKTLTVYAREGRGLFFAFVLLGMLASALYRVYTSVLRPRLQLEQRMSAVLQDLGDYIRLAGDDTEAVAFLQNLRAQLSSSYDQLARTGTLVGSTATDTFPTRVALAGQWLERWKGIADVRPVSVRDAFRDKLRDVAKALVDPATTDLAAQQTTLGTMPEELDKTLRAELDNTLTTFETELQKRSGDARFDPLLAEVARIRTLKLDEALTALNAARKRYVTILGNDFVTKLAASSGVPGFDAAQWTAVVDRARNGMEAAQQQADAEAATAGLKQTTGAALRSIAEGLTRFVNDKIASGSVQTGAYKAVLPQIADIVTKVDAGQLDDAGTAADAALVAVRQIGAAAGVGHQMGANAAATALPDINGFDVVVDLLRRAHLSSYLGAAGAQAATRAKLVLADLVALLIALLFTLAIAYQTLYANDLTWGGPLAYVAAVLWGAGVHQLAWKGLSSLVEVFKA